MLGLAVRRVAAQSSAVGRVLGARAAAACGPLQHRSSGDRLMQTRELKLYNNGKSGNTVVVKNSPGEFGPLENSDYANKHKYINWETLHPSKVKDVAQSSDAQQLFSDDELTIRRMFECGIHYGHETSMWNPLMSQFLYGHRSGIHIFNLEETLKALRVALTFLRGVAQRGGIILFVNTRPQFESLIRNTAVECGEYYITQKWVPGIITNRLRTFEQDIKPDVVVFLSMPVNSVAIKETIKGKVPTIGICDSDCDPTKVMYPIPGNDDGMDPMRLYCSLLKNAILDGKKNPIAHVEVQHESKRRDVRRRGMGRS